MQILLPPKIGARLIEALQRAGRREIGGILMGEHVADERFRIQDVTIQRRGGGFATFLRAVQGILEPLHGFFRATGHNYRRFNYLGEWHSHPSFALEPSATDEATMRRLVADGDLGAHFVLLLVARLTEGNHLDATVTVYHPQGQFRGELIEEGSTW